MDRMRAVIIGGGFGGLLTGVLLARRGCAVTVLEQSAQAGGCIQTFRRGDAVFDTGLHFTGGLESGGELRGIFSDLGLMDLPWRRLDGEEVVIGGDSWFLPSGYDALEDALNGYFPESASDIHRWLEILQGADEHPEYRQTGAYDALCNCVGDPLLRKVLSGTSLKMELDADRLPLDVFARINDAFARSIWRLEGGGGQIAGRLCDGIRNLGGQVLTSSRVVALEGEDGQVVRAVTSDGRAFDADIFVSDIHPARLVAMAPGLFRRIYRERICSLANTAGFFTANIRLRGSDSVKHSVDGSADGDRTALTDVNRSVFVHTPEADLWHPRTDVLESVGVSFGEGTVDLFTRTLPTPGVTAGMPSAASRQAAEDEDAARRELAARCIEFVSGRFPELAGSVDRTFTSTASTYERYTGTPGGSAYGVVRDCGDTLRTYLSPRTPVGNLFLTGQNIGLHGIPGVAKSAFRTVAVIFDEK